MTDNAVWTVVLKYFGAALSMCLASLGCGYGEGLIAGKASETIARQPAASGEIVRTMLISQAVTETAGIFGLLVGVILLFVVKSEASFAQAVSYFSAGVCMGLGSIGSGIGSGIGGSAACEATGRYPKLSTNLVLTSLIGMAIVQTGCIFALVVSLFLSVTSINGNSIAIIGAVLGAGLSMGFGSIGASVGTGFTTKAAVDGISRNPNSGGLITRIMLLGQAVANTQIVFSFIIAFLILIISKANG